MGRTLPDPSGEREEFGLGYDAVLVGHETGDGRRVIHFHIAAQGPAQKRTEQWARKAGRAIELEFRHDPGWEVLRKWR